MRRFLFSILVFLGVLGLDGCSSDRRALVELVPSSSSVVLAINWRAVDKDASLKQMVKGTEIEKIFRELGISNDNVTEMVLFSEIQNSNNGANGMILRGSYKARSIIDSLKGQGWTEHDSQGHKIYSNVSGSEWMAALKSNSIVLGTRDGVEGAIRAEKDTKQSFASSQAYKKLAAGLSKEQSPISLIVAFPTALQDLASVSLKVSSMALDFAGFGPLAGLLDKIGFVRGLGCTISRKSNLFPVEIVAIMKDEEAATFISRSLNVLKDLTRLAPKGNGTQAEAENLHSIQNMLVTTNHEVINIKVVITEGGLAR
jgi:hypothetical protein